MPNQLQWIPKPNRLSSPQAICLVFLGLFAVPVVLYSSYTLNFHNENARIDESANTIIHDVGGRIAEIKTFMASLVGLHYSSSSLEDDELMIFSQEIRAQNNFISGVGRYEKINHAEREDFELRMSETGLFNFKITDIADTGSARARSTQQYYYPTSLLEPMEPGNLKLLGADLGAVDDLISLLDSITENNETLLSTFPDSWPTGGDLVLFRPVYLGKRAPSIAADRLLQSAGGFWISIDLEALLAGVNPKIRDFDLSIDIVADGTRQSLHAQHGAPEVATYLSSLYARSSHAEEWRSGTSSVVVKLQHDIGYTKETLGVTLITLIGLILVSSTYTMHIVGRRKALHDQLASRDAVFKEREKAETTLNSVQDAIITLDEDMRVVHINPAAVIQFNTKSSNAIGRPLSNIVQFQIVGEPFAIFNVERALENLALNSKGEFDVAPVGQDHSDFVLRLTLTSTYHVNGIASGHVLVLRDISHERRLTRKLAFQANHDSLTGCTNRHYFEQMLAGLIDELPFTQNTHTLCYMDLDQFKVVNDTCGHRAGDRLLTELTENLRMLIGDDDVLSRLGGDEFGLLMVNVTPTQAMERSQRIFDFFQNYVFHHDEKAFAVRASIGIVHIDEACVSMMDIMAAADIACYAAKDSGRNTMYVYSKTDDAMAERSVELNWLPRLQNALQNDEFRLHVQAMASVQELPGNDAIHHFEFLLRLANPDGSESTPWQFIQAAERYDLMRDIDKWVIRNALQKVSQLKGGPAQHCSFSINLSGQSAADPGLKHYIREQIAHFQVDPSLIWFELTETAAISHFSVAVDLITDIRALGSKVALDDFGSGLSSFGYLKNLPVDIIKIDGQFVREIARNKIDREMVKAIYQVGQSMGIQTVAEFVESQDIVDVLTDIGIHYAQGYHIGKPCPVEDAVALLPEVLHRAA